MGDSFRPIQVDAGQNLQSKTPLGNRRPTSSHGAQGQPLDVAHALGLALAAGPERWTAMEGGCPILIDGECIGGVGVSGGDWATDERIAREAVESIGASPK